MLSFIVFGSGYNSGGDVKQKLAKKIKEEAQFETVAEETKPTIDSTFKKIIQYDPSVQALFLESDIQNAIAAIKAAYQRRAYDNRYKCFLQQARFFEMMFSDRKELRGNYKDIENYNKSLEDCKVYRTGLQQAIMQRHR
ncbi:hypothetical protein DXN05_24285 [Deminuibacter soli]|uniref:Uncharacterized protein n=1 Tax=Deminuibacter soli TaxID=2291815 RepID=A0A3E1NCW5_9BACT|nr:hypothetical protein DXN05_24285 [Deminuibacter soli]